MVSSHDIPFLPAGVSELTPAGAALVGYIEEKVRGVFGLWGYQEIRTPSLEYVETMSLGLTGEELDMAFKLVDRGTGKMMLLRSDVTPQVARMASRAMSGVPLPLRLCYVLDVYRHPADPSQPRREMIQAGVELIGLDDPQADAEVLAIAIQAMRAMGLAGITVSVGHVQYAKGLFKEASVGRADQELIVAAACRKDRSELERILRSIPLSPGLREGMMILTDLKGTGDTLDRAHAAAPNGTCRRAVEHLREILALAGSYGVKAHELCVDLGELTSFHYHTGPVFTGFVSGSGRAVIKGGRYDNLTGKYGREAPATGFAIDLLEAMEVVGGHTSLNAAIDFLLVNRTGRRQEGLELSVRLRGMGKRVLGLIRDIPDDDLGLYAREHSIEKVLVLDDGGLWHLDTETGARSPFDIEA